MKAALFAAAIGVCILSPFQALAYPVSMPSGNIVRNPIFSDNWNHWSGDIKAGLGAWPTIPNNNALMVKDVYQDLQTVVGQQYSLRFYMAADLYFGPSVTVNVNIGGTTLETIISPPYPYDNQVNRIEQAHWQEVTRLFTATGATTRLEFADLNTYDFLIASVSVVPVPEPTMLSLLVGGYGTFAIAWRRRRSNEPSV